MKHKYLDSFLLLSTYYSHFRYMLPSFIKLMHKFLMTPTMALLMSLILGTGLAAFTNSNSASAQNYGYPDNYGDTNYSTHPTDDKPYECRTGPLEGFFVSSVEFCKNVKFDDNKKDSETGKQGPQG